MLIVCMTLSAAADVLSILLGARLLPGSTFHVTSPMPPDTSYHFTFSATPPAHLVAQVRAIPDTTIVEEDAT
jgi:hypothetical protein